MAEMRSTARATNLAQLLENRIKLAFSHGARYIIDFLYLKAYSMNIPH